MVRKYRTNRNTSTESDGTGAFVHEHVNTASEPEHRPPPASMLPSWSVNTKGTCVAAICPDRIDGFSHRHVPGFPLAEYTRNEDELDAEELDPGSPWNIAGVDR